MDSCLLCRLGGVSTSDFDDGISTTTTSDGGITTTSTCLPDKLCRM